MALSPPEHPAWDSWVVRGRALVGAPPLPRSGSRCRARSDPKFGLGDLFLEARPEQRKLLAAAVGLDPKRAEEYARVSAAWPEGTRLDGASWATHRELSEEPDRFMVLRPGMTMREARRARGRPEVDTKPKHRRSVDERVKEVIAELQDATIYGAIKEHLRRQGDDRRLLRLETEADRLRRRSVNEIRQRQKLLRGAKSAHTGFLEHVEALRLHEQDVWAVQDWLTEGDQIPGPLVEKVAEALYELGKAAFEVLDLVTGGGPSRSPEPAALLPARVVDIAVERKDALV